MTDLQDNRKPSPHWHAVRTFVYIAIFYASFAHNVFWMPSGVYVSRDGFRTGYVGYDSDLVMNRIGMARIGVDPLHPLYWWDYHNARGGFIYTSQFGPQGMVLSQAYLLLGSGDVEAFAGGAACTCVGLTAALLALFFGSIARRLGPTTADVGVLLTAFTPVLLPFAASLYWACFLLLAPFVMTWWLVPLCTTRSRFTGLLALVAALGFLKCLCGYEYVSTVIVSPLAALVYQRTARGDRLRSQVMPSAALVAAGVLGFAAAIGLHVLQLQHITDGDALAVIRERAAGNTIGTQFDTSVATSCAAPDPKFLPSELRVRVRCLLNYFWLPAFSTPTTWGPFRTSVSLGMLVLLTAALGGRTLRRRARNPEAAALVPALLVGLLGALAWHLVALTHTCIHQHLNLICYAVPFLPLAYSLLGWWFQRAAERAPLLRFAPGMFLAVVLAGNLLVSCETDTAGDTARVEAVLRGDEVVLETPRHFLGPVLSMNESPRHLDSESWFHCRLRPDFNGDGTPTRVLNGWVLAGPTRSHEPMWRMVAVAKQRVLPLKVKYARIDLQERLSGGKSTSTFFALAVPEVAIPPGERLRLFIVNAETGDVAELPVP